MAMPCAPIIMATTVMPAERLNEAAWPCRVRPLWAAEAIMGHDVSMKRHGHAVCAAAAVTINDQINYVSMKRHGHAVCARHRR